MNEYTALAFKERVCDVSDRLPASAFPFYSESKQCTIAIGDLSCTVTFDAERDLLLTDMSISVTQTDTPDVEIGATVSITYCGITLADSTNVAEFGYCCSRKPIFLVGVREDKSLKITVTLATANAEETTVEVTLSGFQGNGCCN
jgi:hypothetical protein